MSLKTKQPQVGSLSLSLLHGLQGARLWAKMEGRGELGRAREFERPVPHRPSSTWRWQN